MPSKWIFAIAWYDRWREVREDTTLFLRAGSQPRLLERLARERARLAGEIDVIAKEVERWSSSTAA